MRCQQVQDAVLPLFLTCCLCEIDHAGAWLAKRFNGVLAVSPAGLPRLSLVIVVKKWTPLTGNLCQKSSVSLIEDEFNVHHCSHRKATASRIEAGSTELKVQFQVINKNVNCRRPPASTNKTGKSASLYAFIRQHAGRHSCRRRNPPERFAECA